MVSAAKLRKAQGRITQMRPYAQKLEEVLENVSNVSDDIKSDFAKVRPVENLTIVVITSDKGLCGPFNGNINKATRKFMEDLQQKYPIAKRAVQYA